MPGVIKYSVIIPAYNADRTIGRCLESLISQARKDVQIIVVNDGSTDGTADIIQRFADDHHCIICLHQENNGVSSARNKGLDYASGTFVTFVDSDDYVTGDYFQKLDAMDEDADICYFRYQILGSRRNQRPGVFQQIALTDDWARKMELLLASGAIMQPWSKRFKRQMIEDCRIRFIENLDISEDLNFCLAYSMCCSEIKVYSDIIYCVDTANANSLSRKARPQLTRDINKGYHCAAATLKASGRTEPEKRRLLTVLDYLYTKNVCTCIAETFKYRVPHYGKHRAEYKKIGKTFRDPLGDGTAYFCFIHRGLRFFLKHIIIFPFYAVTWLVKEHKLKKYRAGSTL